MLDEFEKYARDTKREMREKHPTWTLTYWGHYPFKENKPGFSTYALYGQYDLPDDRPEIEGYRKLHPGCCILNEEGTLFTITTDPNEDYA